VTRKKWILSLAAAAVAGGLVGAPIRNAASPSAVDDPFWRAFLSGPPVAGIFAVMAAVVAFYPAFRTSEVAKSNAARDQWWNCAQWALQLAGSDNQADREIAKDALIALNTEATKLESAMIIRVIAKPRAQTAWTRAQM